MFFVLFVRFLNILPLLIFSLLSVHFCIATSSFSFLSEHYLFFDSLPFQICRWNCFKGIWYPLIISFHCLGMSSCKGQGRKKITERKCFFSINSLKKMHIYIKLQQPKVGLHCRPCHLKRILVLWNDQRIDSAQKPQDSEINSFIKKC